VIRIEIRPAPRPAFHEWLRVAFRTVSIRFAIARRLRMPSALRIPENFAPAGFGETTLVIGTHSRSPGVQTKSDGTIVPVARPLLRTSLSTGPNFFPPLAMYHSPVGSCLNIGIRFAVGRRLRMPSALRTPEDFAPAGFGKTTSVIGIHSRSPGVQTKSDGTIVPVARPLLKTSIPTGPNSFPPLAMYHSLFGSCLSSFIVLSPSATQRGLLIGRVSSLTSASHIADDLEIAPCRRSLRGPGEAFV
jgi:hypothetical protein